MGEESVRGELKKRFAIALMEGGGREVIFDYGENGVSPAGMGMRVEKLGSQDRICEIWILERARECERNRSRALV